MTYAIIDMGGKQYRVEEGDSVLVDRVGEDEGAKVSPRAVLYADGKTAVMDGADLGKVKVEAVVAEHVKGEKLRVFKYRPKKRYQAPHGAPVASDAARDQEDKRAVRRQDGAGEEGTGQDRKTKED